MALKRETSKRAEGVGFYTAFTSDAVDVLDYLSGSLNHNIEEDEPSRYGYDGKVFRITLTVEEI